MDDEWDVKCPEDRQLQRGKKESKTEREIWEVPGTVPWEVCGEREGGWGGGML